ncbi:DUF2147 domain-containing protein [Edaphosphingomonas haloaromaticamans]|uniref:DUF2147 domain-containing protein n=1 Tax=Edaphosphingomonas haloaromaticamans TaxID=653954 RepID=A0A1S1HGG0_9SPHN|nr:DUF2147 domain-containing protein [Sphingomonas haloaromaticamans]OHT21305.1 hypothetical protein BHE75_03311 [Sphingomonas haloaromaticamans]
MRIAEINPLLSGFRRVGCGAGGRLSAAALLAILPPVGVHAAEATAPASVLGLWRSQDRGGTIELYNCGPAVCGRILDGPTLRANPDLRDVKNGDKALRTRPVKGLRVFDGFTGGPTQYKGGSLYDPESGWGTKTGYLTLKDPNTLEVKGCVAFFCQSEIMLRIR